MKRTLLILLCVLLTSAIVVAQGHNRGAAKPNTQGASKPSLHRNTVGDCGTSPTLLPDGITSGFEDFIGASGVGYYYQNFDAGHSYSAEVWDPFDSFNGSNLLLSLLDSSCNFGPSYQDVTNITPNMSGANSDRISWIEPSYNTQQIGITNFDTVNGYDFYIRITDTTLINPRWTTYVPFVTSYAFVNKTNTDITGTLTLFDNNSPGTTYTLGVTVPAGGESFVVAPSAGFNVPTNTYGFATFAFVGPAGAITADAFFQNTSGTVVVPSTFAATNFQH